MNEFIDMLLSPRHQKFMRFVRDSLYKDEFARALVNGHSDNDRMYNRNDVAREIVAVLDSITFSENFSKECDEKGISKDQ